MRQFRDIDFCFVRHGDKNDSGIKRLKYIWKKQKVSNKYAQKVSWTKRNTLIIDNTPATYQANTGNAIWIQTWKTAKVYLIPQEWRSPDAELLKIIHLLYYIRESTNVRESPKAIAFDFLSPLENEKTQVEAEERKEKEKIDLRFEQTKIRAKF